jgi:hypothetical protein
MSSASPDDIAHDHSRFNRATTSTMSPTYDRVYFLGAGASAAFGVPITSQILPRVLACLADGTLFGASKKTEEAEVRSVAKREELSAKLTAIFPMVLQGEPPPVTDLFSLIDHLLAVRQSPTCCGSLTDLQQLRSLLEQATLWVLANAKPSGGSRLRGDAHRFYATVVRTGRRDGHRSCFITTNYDRVIERSLLPAIDHFERDLDFGVTWRHYGSGELIGRPTEPAAGIFKLHGSTTWAACARCGHVYIRPNMSIWTVGYRSVNGDFNKCHCEYVPLRSVVVAPSLVRSLDEPCLSSIWRASLEALQEATEWIFVGYSLPNEDIAIRSLLLRGYHGRKNPPPSVHVVQRTHDPALEGRFRFLFPNCTVEWGGFEAYMQETNKGADAPRPSSPRRKNGAGQRIRARS